MPKPRKKRSLTGTDDKQDSTADCSQRVDQDSDVQKVEAAAATESPVAKRAKMGKFKERQYDKYCWVCHFEDCSEKCSFCPRVYHTGCLPRMEITVGDWTCPECQAIVVAEKNRTTSPVMSLLSTDQLCNLLKYSLNRMEMHVPKDFCFGSSSAVFYPMDFPLLEKNIRKKVYTSPAAFLADAKWIFHNHSVYFPLGVPAVKTIMKVCQEEMREIETCPDCYLHAYSMKDKWFSEPCRKPHTLVWAKLKGFPIWPAKAVKTSNGNVDVRFFGGHERAWVPVTHCYFLSRDPPQTISSQKRNFEYAHQEVELHIKLLTQRFGGFEYAPEKTPFNPSQIYLNLNVTLSKLSYLPQSLRDKRKQEVTISTPAKRRLGRAHSAHEVQGSKKEISVDQSLLEKDQTNKTIDSNSEKDKSASLTSLIDTTKSHDENCVDSELVVQLQENTKPTKDLTQLLQEKTCKENNDSPEGKEVNDDKVNLALLGSKDNFHQQGSNNSNFQNKIKIEISDSIETDALKKPVMVKSCDQENTTTVTETDVHCTEDQNNQEPTSTIPTDTLEDNPEHSTTKILNNSSSISVTQECGEESTKMHDNNDVGVTKQVLDNSSSVSVTQELGKELKIPSNSNNNDLDVTKEALDNSCIVSVAQELDNESTKIPRRNDSHHVDVTKEVLGDSSSISVTLESGLDSTKIPISIVDCIDREVSVEADLNVASELIIDTSTTENEDSNHDIASVDNTDTKSESIDSDMNHADSRKDAKDIENQTSTRGDLVSSKQSNEILSPATNFTFSQEKTSVDSCSSLMSSGISLPNMKEIVIVVKDIKEDNKTPPKENDVKKDDISAASTSTSVTLEILKGAVPINKTYTGEDKSTEVIDNTNLNDKSAISTKESGTQAANATDGSVKIITPKVRRTSVHKRDKHTEDMVKVDNKFPEKSEEFHVDDSNLEKNSPSSNSLRIRIVKGKVESDSPLSSGKENQNTHKIIVKAAKSIHEQTNIVSSSKSDFVQNNDSQAKIVTQKPEELPENINKQETLAASTVIRKSKRPRKNFIIQFPHKHNLNDTHSNQDSSRDSSNVSVLSEDCETNIESSNQPDEPDIVKNFKATLEKIHKVKYAKGAVLEKIIDYKSHSAHSNDAPKAKTVKPSTNLTHTPVVIKVPTTTLGGHSTSSSDCASSSTATNLLSQNPCPKTLQISSTKSLQIIAIDNRPNCSAASTSKHLDSSPSCNILHKETEVSHCSNLDSEYILNKGEISSNVKDQPSKEVKIQDKCSNVNMLLQNVQVSLKENSTTHNKEGNPSNSRSQTDMQNLPLPFGDKERNLFNILPVEKYARKLTVFLTNTLEEMCQDIINSGCMQVAMNSLETELEALRDKHKKDLADVKLNADLIMKEMRSTMETEKQNAVAEVRRQCEMEMRKNVEEAKKKQWCANCGKEAVFYCCWNTSYCDYPCQQTHWPQHMSICGQNHVASVKEQQIVRMPNLGPDMTITQSPPSLPLEIQLTTHSPTQTNKNKKKPPSSSEKMPMASRAKGRNLTQSPNAGLQPHDISRSTQMIYPPHYRLQAGQVFPVMLSHSSPHQQQQCGPNVVIENKPHNVQHTVPFQYNPHVCM